MHARPKLSVPLSGCGRLSAIAGDSLQAVRFGREFTNSFGTPPPDPDAAPGSTSAPTRIFCESRARRDIFVQPLTGKGWFHRSSQHFGRHFRHRKT